MNPGVLDLSAWQLGLALLLVAAVALGSVRQALGPDHALEQVRAEGFLQLLPLARGQPVGEGVRVGNVHRDVARVALPPHAGQQAPLRRPPQLALAAVRSPFGLPDRLVQAALRAAAQRQPFHAPRA